MSSELIYEVRECMCYIWNDNGSIPFFIKKCCDKYNEAKNYIDELVEATSFDVSKRIDPTILENSNIDEEFDNVLRQLFRHENVIHTYEDENDIQPLTDDDKLILSLTGDENDIQPLTGDNKAGCFASGESLIPLTPSLTDDEIFYYINLFKIQERIRNKVQSNGNIEDYISNVISLYEELENFKFLTSMSAPYQNLLKINAIAFRFQYDYVKRYYFENINESNEKLKIKYEFSPSEICINLAHPDYIVNKIRGLLVDDIIEILKSDTCNIYAVDVITMFENWEEKERQKPNGIFSIVAID